MFVLMQCEVSTLLLLSLPMHWNSVVKSLCDHSFTINILIMLQGIKEGSILTQELSDYFVFLCFIRLPAEDKYG